jgi:hypothetical protein
MTDIFLPVFIVTVIVLAAAVGLVIFLDRDANRLDR